MDVFCWLVIRYFGWVGWDVGWSLVFVWDLMDEWGSGWFWEKLELGWMWLIFFG